MEEIKNIELINKLKGIVKKHKGVITPNEAIVESGYSKDEVHFGLDRLLELFEVRVNLNEDTGALQYIFKYPLFERGKHTLKENLARAVSFLYKIFKVIYKSAVGIVLIVYTVVFALVVLAISFAGKRNNNDDRSNIGVDMISMLFRVIIEMIFLRREAKLFEYAVDPYGNRYKTYPKKEKKSGGFIQSVFTFVFGPEQPKFDPLSDAREVAAYIRLISKGKLTSANIIELSGADYPLAESKLAEYAGRFQGNLEISNDGVLYGDFQNMLGNVSIDEKKYIEYYKDEVEPPVLLTGNTGGRNFGIIAMNAFNLIMSFLLFDAFIPYELESGEVVNVMTQFGFIYYFLWFGIIVSISYFIIPLIRIPAFIIKKKKYKKRLLHKLIIGHICSARKKEFILSEIVHSLKIEKNYEENIVQQLLDEIVIELQGTIEISSEGIPIYNFERLYNELKVS